MNTAMLAALSPLALAAPPAVCPPPAVPPVRLMHWPQFPVRVYLSPRGPGHVEEVQAVLAGFDEWVAASHGKLCYVQVPDAGKADITVQLEPKPYLSVGTRAVGETTVCFSGGVLKKANIRLAENNAVSEDLQATAAHEFGHALGISYHSEDPNDLMYPVEIVHFEAASINQTQQEAPHTVTARDLDMLRPCYPLLLGAAGRRP